MPVMQVRHPLVRHKMGLLRQAGLPTKDFRAPTSELGRLLAYEATADFPLETTTIDCWSGPATIVEAQPPCAQRRSAAARPSR